MEKICFPNQKMFSEKVSARTLKNYSVYLWPKSSIPLSLGMLAFCD